MRKPMKRVKENGNGYEKNGWETLLNLSKVKF